MKHLLCLLSLFVSFVLACLAEEPFVRITSVEQITEDGEYIIGAKALAERPFYLMKAELKKNHLQGIPYGDEVPEVIEGETDAAVCHFVRQGDKLVIKVNEMYVNVPKPKETGVEGSYSFHTLWTVSSSKGEFYFQSGERYFLLSSSSKDAVFGYYSLPLYEEGPIVIYKRSVPLSEWNSYARFWEATGWETVCLPFTCEVPSGFEAYAVEGADGETLQYQQVQTLQAGVAYVVKGEAGALFSVSGSGNVLTPQEGLLRGVFASETLHTGYVLDGKDFVPAAEKGCFLSPFRAYIRAYAE